MGEDVSGEGSVGSVDFSPASPSTWQKLDLLLAFSLTTVTSRRGGAAGGGGGGKNSFKCRLPLGISRQMG